MGEEKYPSMNGWFIECSIRCSIRDSILCHGGHFRSLNGGISLHSAWGKCGVICTFHADPPRPPYVSLRLDPMIILDPDLPRSGGLGFSNNRRKCEAIPDWGPMGLRGKIWYNKK